MKLSLDGKILNFLTLKNDNFSSKIYFNMFFHTQKRICNSLVLLKGAFAERF